MPYSALINVSNVPGIQMERKGDRGSLDKVNFLFFFKVWFMFHSVIKKSSPAVVWPEMKVLFTALSGPLLGNLPYTGPVFPSRVLSISVFEP